MSKAHSTPSAPCGKPAKPSKPYPDFPLTAHPVGRWCKKIRGKIFYFGSWDDWQAALDNYHKQKDDLHAGRTPRPDPEALTIERLCNTFIHQKQALVDAGEVSPRTLREYKDACEEIGAVFGSNRLFTDLRPEDFAALRKRMAKKWGAYRLSNVIQYIRSVFKYGYDAELIDRPIRFGPGFKRPSKKVVRLHRAERGPKLFTAGEVRRMIDTAGLPLKAMVLLGIDTAVYVEARRIRTLSRLKHRSVMLKPPCVKLKQGLHGLPHSVHRSRPSRASNSPPMKSAILCPFTQTNWPIGHTATLRTRHGYERRRSHHCPSGRKDGLRS